jgi:3-oxoadipate enol-lactonase
MPVDQVNGAELYWERRGSGPRLLFCNASDAPLRVARPLLDSLASTFDLLAWDYRGLGGSAPPMGPYAMADLVADAVGLLKIAGWDACRVFGVSFGGMVALEFAVTNPERVERLALACTSAGGDGGSSYPLQELRGLPPGERAAALLRLADTRWDERWLESHPADRVLAELVTAGHDQQDQAAVAAYAAQLEARGGHDVWDRLDAITCPTLVGYGEYDGIAPAPNSVAIASRLGRADLRGYAGGHVFLFQDPAALPEFEAFLRAGLEHRLARHQHSMTRPRRMTRLGWQRTAGSFAGSAG